MVPIESMACGTIAIWHDSWGMRETIPDVYRYKNEAEMLKVMEWKFKDNVSVSDFTWNSTVSTIRIHL
jgi:hypothetical protein